MRSPGRFREKVAIQSHTRTPDGAGGYTEEWDDVATWAGVYADVSPLRGDEQLQAMQTTAQATHRVRLWALEGVKSTTHRIRRHRDNGIMEIVAPPMYDASRLQMDLLVRETEEA